MKKRESAFQVGRILREASNLFYILEHFYPKILVFSLMDTSFTEKLTLLKSVEQIRYTVDSLWINITKCGACFTRFELDNGRG
jgi:hypothetical protein